MTIVILGAVSIIIIVLFIVLYYISAKRFESMEKEYLFKLTSVVDQINRANMKNYELDQLQNQKLGGIVGVEGAAMELDKQFGMIKNDISSMKSKDDSLQKSVDRLIATVENLQTYKTYFDKISDIDKKVQSQEEQIATLTSNIGSLSNYLTKSEFDVVKREIDQSLSQVNKKLQELANTAGLSNTTLIWQQINSLNSWRSQTIDPWKNNITTWKTNTDTFMNTLRPLVPKVDALLKLESKIKILEDTVNRMSTAQLSFATKKYVQDAISILRRA